MKVIMIYGSANDKAFMRSGRTYMDEQGLVSEEEVLSAHRDLPEQIEYLEALENSGQRAAGLPTAQPGLVAMKTGLPVNGGLPNDIDALRSACQVSLDTAGLRAARLTHMHTGPLN